MIYRSPAPLFVPCLVLAVAAGLACRPGEEPDAPPPLLPEAAVEQAREALALSDPLERATRTHALLRRAPPEALTGLREAVDGAPLDVGDPEILGFAMWWAGFDPEGAVQWTVADRRGAHYYVVKNVFEVWAYGDPELAYKRVHAIPPHLREGAMRGAIAGWQRSGKPGLVETVRAISDLREQQSVAESLARRMVLQLGAEGAIAWSDEIGNPDFRTTMRRRIASAAAELGEAEAVARWAESLVSKGSERTTGLPRRIGTRWIMSDPQAAFAWLRTLPAGRDRDDGVMESYRDWMQRDRMAAIEWAKSTEIEPWNEPAFSIYLRQLGMEDPEAALAGIARFENERERNRHALIVAQRWADRDPEAAAEWLANAELGDRQRERLRARIQQRLDRSGSSEPAEPGAGRDPGDDTGVED